jgi:hypothetical protein
MRECRVDCLPFANDNPAMRAFLLTAFLAVCLAPGAGRAQLALPGAVNAPTQAGQAGAPPARVRTGDAAIGPNFTPGKPPAVDSVIGHAFALNGFRGALLIERAGGELRVARLKLAGYKISAPNQSCEVEMGGAEPVALKPLGAPEGVLRYELVSSACPLQLELLNGAVLARHTAGACVFAQADCRSDAAGLWGPPGDSFGEASIRTIEHDRTTQEHHVHALFRGVLEKFKEDRAAAQAAVKDQAGFSAARAQTCRDYDREDRHGFCALRLTEAHDYHLQVRLAGGKTAQIAPVKMVRKPRRVMAPRPLAPPPEQ